MSAGTGAARAPARPIPAAHVVFGRGGIRGIAMAGAAATLVRAGCSIERVSGISVGGIVAALVASGHTPDEIRRVVRELDCGALRDGGSRPVPVVGAVAAPLWRLLTRMGCYDGDGLHGALREILARKGVRTFADLRAPDREGRESPYRLQVLCSDLTRARLVVLPDDAVHYGLDPDRLEVALALRASASLPFFFRPVPFGPPGTPSLLVDGGLVAGIPFRVFPASRSPRWVTFGVQAGPGRQRRPSAVAGPLSLLRAVYYTALRANQEALDPGAAIPTLEIDCGPVAATDFGLSDLGKETLFEAGAAAARRFLAQGLRARPAPLPDSTRPADAGHAAPLAGSRPDRQLFVAGG